MVKYIVLYVFIRLKIIKMNGKKDYYSMLGVDRGVSQDDLKKVYKKLSKKHHPDK